MAVHYAFFATPHVVKSVPCSGKSISVGELKDAIAAPIEAALGGRTLREKFDLLVYRADTKEEVVGHSSRVQKNTYVLVKRVPARCVKPSRDTSMSPMTNKVTESIVVDDGFGDDIFTVEPKAVPEAEVALLHVEAKVVPRVEGTPKEKCVRKSRVVQSGGSGRGAVDVSMSRRSEAVPHIPPEMLCSLCQNVMKEPVLIRCCCITFCAQCITAALLERKSCPSCGSCKCGVADLLPNRHITSMIHRFDSSHPGSVASSSCSTLTTASLISVDPLEDRLGEHGVDRKTPTATQKRKPLVIVLNNNAKKFKAN